MSPKMYTVEVTDPSQPPRGETTALRNILSQCALTESRRNAVRTTLSNSTHFDGGDDFYKNS